MRQNKDLAGVGVMYRPWRALGGLTLSLLLCVPVFAQPPSRSSIALAQFELWLSTTESLIEARNLAVLFDLTATGEGVRRQFSANGLAVARLQNALLALTEESASAGSGPQHALRMPVATLHGLFERHLTLLQKRELQSDRPDVLGELNANLARVQAQIRDGWKTWMDVTRAFSDAFTDQTRERDGASPRLYLTDADRQAMLEQLQKRFPQGSTRRLGQDPLQDSVGVMMQALRYNRRPADAK